MLLRKYALVENKEICSNLFLPEMFVSVFYQQMSAATHPNFKHP